MAGLRWTLTSAALLLTAAAPVPAGWSPLGGPGVPVVELQLAPSRPDLLYVNADEHLWRSEDAGGTWRSLQAGLGRSTDVFVLDPADPEILWAWTSEGELWRSGDAGETWSRRFATSPDDTPVVARLLVDPRDPETIYRVDLDDESSVFGARVAVSRDGGASFQTGSFLPGAGRNTIAVHRERGELVSFGRNGLLVSGDGGRTWSRRGRYHGKGFEYGRLAPSDPDTLYAVAVGSACPVRSDDAGAHWLRLACPRLPAFSLGFYNLAVDPNNARHVWLVAYVVLREGYGHWLFESKSGGETWSPPRLMPSAGVVPAGGRTVYTGAAGLDELAGRDLSVSRDGGRTWRSVAAGISAGDVRSGFVAQRRPDGTAGRRLVARSSSSLFRSDGGSSWLKLPLEKVTSVAGAGGSTVVAVSDGRVVRSEDGGATWSGVTSAPPGAGSLVSDPLQPRYVALHQFELNDELGNLFFWMSDDGGATWRRPSEGLPAACSHVGASDYCLGYSGYAVDPFDPSRRYASREAAFFSPAGIFVSKDGGVSWHATAGGLPGNPPILELAADPAAPGRLLAGTYPGLFLSEDGGEHWRPWGDLPSAAAVYQLVRDEGTATWYAATGDDGIYRSLDGGAHWTLLDGAPDLETPTIAVDPRRPAALLAAFRGLGVWRWTP